MLILHRFRPLIIGATVAFTLAAALPAAAETKRPTVAEAFSDDNLVEARAIIEIMLPPEKRMETFGSVVRNMLDQMRANATREVTDPGLARIVNDHLDTIPARLAPIIEKHIPLMLDAQAKAYARAFSLDELKQIRTFAETPAGQHYLTEAPKLMGDPDVAATNRAYMADVMDEARNSRGGLTEQVRAYLVKHPEAAPKPRAVAPEGR